MITLLVVLYIDKGNDFFVIERAIYYFLSRSYHLDMVNGFCLLSYRLVDDA